MQGGSGSTQGHIPNQGSQMTDLYFGIDPGVSGAVACLDPHGHFLGVEDMPTTTATTGRRAVSASLLAGLLRRWMDDAGAEPRDCLACIEQVNSRPGESHVASFSFGRSWGVALAVPEALQIPSLLVTPQRWKKQAGLPPGAGKDASRALAMARFPEAAQHLTRKRDDGRAEALLIALFAFQTQKGTTA
jgi:hypothetical protein